MSKFSREDRKVMPNRVCMHFDKYCQLTNPFPLNPTGDIYKPLLEDGVWDAMQVLLKSKKPFSYLNEGWSWELYVDDEITKSRYRRPHITFPFGEDNHMPDLKLDLINHPDPSVIEQVRQWESKARAYAKLRRTLWNRIECLLDHGWDSHKAYDSYRGSWRGGPTAGQGCNTAGQVMRLWPELVAFLPLEYRDSIRGAQVRSRMPKFIKKWGTPEQFMLKDRPYHYNKWKPDYDPELEQREPFSDEEWMQSKRLLDGINHILTQMSLMKDVPSASNYPTLSL